MKKTVIEKQMDELRPRLDALSKALPENKIVLIVFSGDLDMVPAAVICATGAPGHGHGCGHVLGNICPARQKEAHER